MANAPQKLPRGIYEKEPGSKIYWIRYAQFGGKIRREKAGSLANAKRLLTIRHGQKLAGKLPTPAIKVEAPKPLLFGGRNDAAIKYSNAQSGEAHAADLILKLERVRSAFGARVASEITSSEIVEWLDSEMNSRSWRPASRNRYQAAISLVFRVAMEDQKLSRNPASSIKRKKEDNQRKRYLTSEEESRLIAAIEARWPSALYASVVTLAIQCGPRASELFRGRVGDYNPLTGKITIHQTKVRNAPSERYVPLARVGVEAYERLVAGKAEGEYLCTNIDSQYPIENIDYWFAPCMEAAGIADFNFHDLRHTAASRWVSKGVPLAVVASYLGHQNIQMTMRYSHCMPDNDEI